MSGWFAYAGLFVVALAAATVLPLQSEAVLVGLLLGGMHSTVGLLVAAIAGNTLGAVVNWMLGRWLERWRDRPWFPVGEPALARAQRWYGRYGRWSLLLCWVPVAGDPLTVIAGVLREPLPTFLLLVTLAKSARYLVLAALTLGAG